MEMCGVSSATSKIPDVSGGHLASPEPKKYTCLTLQFASGCCKLERGALLTNKDKHDTKLAAGIWGILFGWLGVHKFILGYTKEGIIQVVMGLVTFEIAWLISIVEGIIYLTKSDEEFYNAYIANKRPWF